MSTDWDYSQILDPEMEDVNEQPPRAGWALCAFYDENSYEWMDPTKLVRLEEGLQRFGKNSITKQALAEANSDNN